MAKLNKEQFITLVAEVKGSTKKDARESVDAVLGAIESALANGDDVALSGHGTYEVRERSARTGRNPQTGEAIAIPEGKTVGFKVSDKLKGTVKA